MAESDHLTVVEATSTEFEECDHRWISWLDNEYWSCLSCGDMFYEGPPLEGW